MEKPKDVDSYIENSVRESRSIMKELRELIKMTIPEAEEVISWNVPIYKYNNGILAGYSVARKHVSFGVDTLKNEDRELLKEEGYKTGKKTIQIKFDQQVPATIIKKILLEQVNINESK